MNSLQEAKILESFEADDLSQAAGHTLVLIRALAHGAVKTYAQMRNAPPVPDSCFKECYHIFLKTFSGYETHKKVFYDIVFDPELDQATGSAKKIGSEHADFFVSHFAQNTELASCAVNVCVSERVAEDNLTYFRNILERGWRAAATLACSHCVVVSFQLRTGLLEAWVVNKQGHYQKLF